MSFYDNAFGVNVQSSLSDALAEEIAWTATYTGNDVMTTSFLDRRGQYHGLSWRQRSREGGIA